MDIAELKKEKNAFILAHNYQLPEIQDVADFVGDSLELAQVAQDVKEDLIVMCGVDFMADMVSLLNPDKKVLVPEPDATCPMAHMLTPEEIEAAKKEHPKADVVLYVNSTTECKALADCLCTSANVKKVVEEMPSDTILFGPDRNMVHFVQKETDKKIIPITTKAYCPTHDAIALETLKFIRSHARTALFLVHPECRPEVQEFADNVMGTSGMLKTAKKLDFEVYVIGTEDGLVYRLRNENPGKKFQSVNTICPNMKKTTLEKLADCIENEKNEVKIPEALRKEALKPLKKMLKLSE